MTPKELNLWSVALPVSSSAIAMSDGARSIPRAHAPRSYIHGHGSTCVAEYFIGCSQGHLWLALSYQLPSAISRIVRASRTNRSDARMYRGYVNGGCFFMWGAYSCMGAYKRDVVDVGHTVPISMGAYYPDL